MTWWDNLYVNEASPPGWAARHGRPEKPAVNVWLQKLIRKETAWTPTPPEVPPHPAACSPSESQAAEAFDEITYLKGPVLPPEECWRTTWVRTPSGPGSRKYMRPVHSTTTADRNGPALEKKKFR